MAVTTLDKSKADFSGYVTKANLKCSDGRTIKPEAFKDMDGETVPLMWAHKHDDAGNVLGHVLLEGRADGVYGYGFFNETAKGKDSKILVQHGDIKALSIYANKLVEKSKQVFHGVIREVSLVLAGANKGAFIDNVQIAHSEFEIETLEDEAIISTGLELEHIAMPEEGDVLEHATEETIQEILDSFSEKQKQVMNYLVGQALQEAAATHSDEGETPNPDGDPVDDNNDEGDLEHTEGQEGMTRNVFEGQGGGAGAGTAESYELTHDDMKGIIERTQKLGSLKDATEEFAIAHGITNLSILFPEARTLNNTPEWNKRQTEWVSTVLGGVHKSPFSRIKSVVADITQDAARALGYIKGNYKKEEWFSLTKRTTTPTTIYKKQALDRDDVVDITDFDVVVWMKGEMRLMLEEELARAILIGDGRDVGDEDKIKDPMGIADGEGIRSILNDNELYVTTVNVNIDDANSSMLEVTDAILGAREFYKGTGTPTLFTTEQWLTKMLLTRDANKQRYWKTVADLASEIRVSGIVTVEPMETVPDVIGILVNLSDYNIGADKGGEVTLFDDFDLDYNKLKYLIETRCSGALTKIKSAQVVRKVASANVLAVPQAPGFSTNTGVINIPTVTGVVYKDGSPTGATMTAGAQGALAAGASKSVFAVPASGYYFATNEDDSWSFTRSAS